MKYQGILSLSLLLVVLAIGCTTGTVSDGNEPVQVASDDNAKYREALADPENLLSAPTQPLHHDDAVFGGTLRRGVLNVPQNLNWWTETSEDVRDFRRYVHNTLARQDPENPDLYLPELAYKITVSNDYTEYIVSLREGVYWQTPDVDFDDPQNEWLREPREVTADDMAFYFELARRPDARGVYLSYFYTSLKEVEVLDRYRLRVQWTRPLYNSKLALLRAYPMHRWLLSRKPDGTEIPPEQVAASIPNHWALTQGLMGTGPYQIQEQQEKKLVLRANENYWDRRPPIERIEFHGTDHIYSDELLLMLLRGEIDFLPYFHRSLYVNQILDGSSTSAFHTDDLKYQTIDHFSYYYIGWNSDTPYFEDALVRRAMTLAFDRQRMIDEVLLGLGTLQTSPYYHGHPAVDPSVEPWPFDLGEAARILNEAGWVDTTGDGIRNKTIDGEEHEFRFTLLAFDNEETREWVNLYRKDLLTIGIDMRPEFLASEPMQERLREHNFDAFTGGWNFDWNIRLNVKWHSSQTGLGFNRFGFRNAEADTIIEILLGTFGPNERLALYRRFHQIVHEEQPITFFYAPRDIVIWNPRLQNVIFQSIRPQTYSIPWFIEGGQ